MYDCYEDPIFSRRETLDPDYVPDHLPNRMEEIGFISQLVREYHKGRATHVFIHGPPGTGKTASVQFIFREMEESGGLVSYVNCFNKNTSMGVLYSIFLDFFRKERPTRRMPSRRGIAYDELFSSFLEEMGKSKTRLTVCLDEADKLEDSRLVYDLTRMGIPVQIIAISNDPMAFRDMDPRVKSSFCPLEEMHFRAYNEEQMLEIIEKRVKQAFQKGVVPRKVMERLARFAADRKGDVRIAREALALAGELAGRQGKERMGMEHLEESLEKSVHAKPVKLASELSGEEVSILKLIPDEGIYYPELSGVYGKAGGRLRDRMLRNYVNKFCEMNLIEMERKGRGGSYFIKFRVPKDVLLG